MKEINVRDLAKAQEIVSNVIQARARWGKHAGFDVYSDQEVLDALVVIGNAGFLEAELGENLREALTAANRAKGAAEARESKYKGQLAHAHEQIAVLTEALEEAEDTIHTLEVRLQESLDVSA